MFGSNWRASIADSSNFCSGGSRKLVTGDDLSKIYTKESVLNEYLQGRISKSKLDDMIRKKQIPHFRLGVRVLFRKGELDYWVKAIRKEM